jgi:hypothetical protein
MANYHKRNSIRAVQWDPENAQSFKDIKKLVAENPGLGWKVRDNIIHNCVTIYSFTHDVMRIMPYEYLVEGKKTVFSSFQLNLLNSCTNRTKAENGEIQWLNLRNLTTKLTNSGMSPRRVTARVVPPLTLVSLKKISKELSQWLNCS